MVSTGVLVVPLLIVGIGWIDIALQLEQGQSVRFQSDLQRFVAFQ